MVNWMHLNFIKWAPATAIILIGVFLGWVFKRFIHASLVKAAKKSKWEGDDIFLKALESQIIFWFFLAALSISVGDIKFADPVGIYISKLLVVLLIGSINHAASKIIIGLLNIWSNKQGKGFPSTVMFTNIVMIAIYLIGALIILDVLEISIAPMLTALGLSLIHI